MLMYSCLYWILFLLSNTMPYTSNEILGRLQVGRRGQCLVQRPVTWSQRYNRSVCGGGAWCWYDGVGRRDEMYDCGDMIVLSPFFVGCSCYRLGLGWVGAVVQVR